MIDNRKPWTDFWAAKGSNSQASGCIPSGLKSIDLAQTHVWQSLARSLPKNARIVDLGSGDGAVLRKLLAVRRDIKPVGVDYSSVLPKPPKGAQFKCSVDMAQLPFAESSIDAVTSQFAYEYGSRVETASEIARILRPAGRLVMIVHLQDGPIVQHNMPRIEQLKWVLEEQQTLTRAANYVRHRGSFTMAVPAFFQQLPSIALQQFGQGSVAVELATAIRDTLLLGQRQQQSEVQACLDQLGSMATNEIGRIESLMRASSSKADLDDICSTLAARKIDCSYQSLEEHGAIGRQFAWLLEGISRK